MDLCIIKWIFSLNYIHSQNRLCKWCPGAVSIKTQQSLTSCSNPPPPLFALENKSRFAMQKYKIVPNLPPVPAICGFLCHLVCASAAINSSFAPRLLPCPLATFLHCPLPFLLRPPAAADTWANLIYEYNSHVSWRKSSPLRPTT